MGKRLKLNEFLGELGYLGSDYYLKGADLKRHPAYSHFFRKARKDMSLKGVYCLRARPERKIAQDTVVPVVYVVELDSDDPDTIQSWHRKVWNQSLVPFVLLATPTSFRVYRGFEAMKDIKKDHIVKKPRDISEGEANIFQDLQDISSVLEAFNDFKAESIDNGSIWEKRKKDLRLESRVDHKLLKNLKSLGDVLVEEQKLDSKATHALIGKYVFLRYLRDRKHLSDKKFEEFGLKPEDIFGDNAKIDALYDLESKLNGWLNGSIFQLPHRNGTIKIKANHVKEVARAFRGDDPQSGQMALFEMFDFEYVPVETLSAVYEQFLHFDDKGRQQGAYYTPLHLVNFVLEELDAKRPFKEGMRVFDPACGSGAFLVQCYRLLIEREIKGATQVNVNPSQLRELLEKHIFGLDIDEEACNVTELSSQL